MKPRVIGVSVLLVVILLLAGGNGMWAGQNTPAKSPGSVCYEYSNDLDEQAVAGGGAHDGLRVGMVLYTEPPDPAGAPDPKNIRQLGAWTEVDAIANYGDAYFPQVVRNQADLLVSFKLPNPPPTDPNDPFSNATYYERWNGVTGVKWTQANYSNPDPAWDMEDLDGLEIWGPMDASDVNRYSVFNDWATPTATSVYNYVSGGPDTPYISQALIANAVTNLGFIGDPDSVDVDGLMVRDYGRRGIFDDRDEILFSIRATGNFDGGEIIHLKNGSPPAWLSHGGHLWNTAFPVAATFGVSVEEVDAIEAVNKSEDGYWVSMRWRVRFRASPYIGPGLAVTLDAETPASMALSKDDVTEGVDLLWATAAIEIGPDIGDTSTVAIVHGHGEFDGYVFDGVSIPTSDFTIEPDSSAGIISWPEEHMIISAKVTVSATGFPDIEAEAFGSGYIADYPDTIDLVFGEAIEIIDSGVPGEHGSIPEFHDLLRSSPNPFSPTTTIEYEVRRNTRVRIAVYNVRGERVRILVDEPMPGGLYSVVWDGRDDSGALVSDGVYYCRMEAGPVRQMKKLVFLK